MTFNELQKTWQKNEGFSKLTIDSDLLLREIKKNKEAFDLTVFWRDFREVTVAIILFGVFMHSAFKAKENIWVAGSLVLLAFMCLFIAAFFLVDRRLQRKKDTANFDPLLACIESSLAKVNHQIWLLKNVFWWYLLPPGAGAFLFGIIVTWNVYRILHSWRVLLSFVVSWLVTGILFWGVYWLNQYAVRKELIPRKNELESLLKTLTGNGSSS